MNLVGSVVDVKTFTDKDINEMYALMAEFYDNIQKDIFIQDLYDKEYCIILKDEDAKIQGFSTQKILHFPVDGKEVNGLFSGDTIVHKQHWGSLEGIRTVLTFGLECGKRYENFYWFLIVKGYKTYKILPTFFKEFYPNYREKTPTLMQKCIDSFGEYFYPNEYNKLSGIIEYTKTKDILKDGVADITERRMKDHDIRFFCEKNPHHLKGNDMICITRLHKDTILDKVKHRLFMERKA